MNIWTHLFGFFLVVGLTINDLVIINIHATVTDKVVAAILLSCFMVSLYPNYYTRFYPQLRMRYLLDYYTVFLFIFRIAGPELS